VDNKRPDNLLGAEVSSIGKGSLVSQSKELESLFEQMESEQQEFFLAKALHFGI